MAVQWAGRAVASDSRSFIDTTAAVRGDSFSRSQLFHRRPPLFHNTFQRSREGQPTSNQWVKWGRSQRTDLPIRTGAGNCSLACSFQNDVLPIPSSLAACSQRSAIGSGDPFAFVLCGSLLMPALYR